MSCAGAGAKTRGNQRVLITSTAITWFILAPELGIDGRDEAAAFGDVEAAHGFARRALGGAVALTACTAVVAAALGDVERHARRGFIELVREPLAVRADGLDERLDHLDRLEHDVVDA
jgi:hypothetical protein